MDERQLIQSGYRYAMALTHNRHDAEDLIQQACLQVIQKKGRLVSKKYLFVAIRNLFYDHGRRIVRTKTSKLNHETLVDSAVSHVREVDGRIDLQQLLATLRSEEREVLYLNAIAGFTAKEISEMTDQPRNTVLSLMSRARKKLERRMTSDSMKGEVL